MAECLFERLVLYCIAWIYHVIGDVSSGLCDAEVRSGADFIATTMRSLKTNRVVRRGLLSS